MQGEAERMRLIFIVDDNFLLRITHGLSNSGQEFCEWKKTAQ
jgi:hypothetical protein